MRVLLFAAAVVLICETAGAQLSYSSGQMVSPAYEGWEKNLDGSFNMLFGYMNDNWEEELIVPVGPGNNIEPGGPDQGQPTHFFPRRNRFVFRVRVPQDFGDKDLIWTLTTHGKTVKAYGSLRQDYFVDDMVFTSETGAIGAGTSNPEIRRNTPPVLEAAGDTVRTVKVGEALVLTAHVTDDGIPKPRARGAFLDRGGQQNVKDIRLIPPKQSTVGSATGLWVSCYVYRGPGMVKITPDQAKTWEDTRAGANSQWSPLWQAPPPPPDDNWTATATFDTPGTYILRWHASDGALWKDQNITVTVTP
ncbi:MAG: hypothetical protein ABSB35_08185 [Bryobacteraceae bacterium]|jgi:hypothetical protein